MSLPTPQGLSPVPVIPNRIRSALGNTQAFVVLYREPLTSSVHRVDRSSNFRVAVETVRTVYMTRQREKWGDLAPLVSEHLDSTQIFTATQGYSAFTNIQDWEQKTVADLDNGGTSPFIITVGPGFDDQLTTDAYVELIQASVVAPGAHHIFPCAKPSRFPAFVDLMQSLEQSNTVNTGLLAKIEQLESKIEALQTKLESSEHSNKDLKRLVKDARNEATIAKQMCCSLQNKVDDSERINQSLQTQLDDLRRWTASLDREAKGLSQTNITLCCQIEKLQGDMLARDKDALNQIKARHLVVVVQEYLAIISNATDTKIQAAVKWRQSLTSEPQERMEDAKRKLASAAEKDPSLRQFMDSPGFKLLVDDESKIRTLGDRAAHPFPIQREDFKDVAAESPEMMALLEFAIIITKRN